MNASSARKLIAGDCGGRSARVLRALLQPASVAYSAVIRARNYLYDSHRLQTHKSPVPVISIGNITTGGTGKTPMVIWLCNYLHRRNARCAILTRGYKSGKGALSDEPAVLARACPYAPVVVEPDRVAGAARAVEQFDATVLVMDDGFQHRRLARELDIVTIDATCPFGCGRLLPAGLLREPAGSLSRADAVVITRSDQIEPEQLTTLEEQLAAINPNLAIARAVHKPTAVKTFSDAEIGLDRLRDKKILAFCGIANPQAFSRTLDSLGVETSALRTFPDHHRYSTKDLEGLYDRARRDDADILLTTSKDWVKTATPGLEKHKTILAYVDIRLELIAGEDKITRLIDGVLP